jgi:hypothetical protein
MHDIIFVLMYLFAMSIEITEVNIAISLRIV